MERLRGKCYKIDSCGLGQEKIASDPMTSLKKIKATGRTGSEMNKLQMTPSDTISERKKPSGDFESDTESGPSEDFEVSSSPKCETCGENLRRGKTPKITRTKKSRKISNKKSVMRGNGWFQEPGPL